MKVRAYAGIGKKASSSGAAMRGRGDLSIFAKKKPDAGPGGVQL